MSSKHYQSSKTGCKGPKSRKRQRTEERERLQGQLGIELPDIPGLPIAIIPLQVHALKVTTKYFQKNVGTSIECPRVSNNGESNEPEDISRQPSRTSDSLNDGRVVVGTLLHRMELANQTANTSAEERRAARDRQNGKNEAIASWLQAIHRAHKDILRQKQALSRQQQQQDLESGTLENSTNHPVASNGIPSDRSLVPVAAWKHVMGVAQGHPRLIVRRAALHMAAQLLFKSSDCRRCLLDDQTNHEDTNLLMEWMDSVGIGANNSSSSNQAQLACLQRESYLLLQSLQDDGYDSLYVTLPLALQRFRQLYPHVLQNLVADETTTPTARDMTNTGRSMVAWRRARDLAMEYHDKETKAVHKLIRRAHACFDILVPLYTIAPKPLVPDDGSEDDDDDIDWEDGMDGEGSEAKQEQTETSPDLHERAVERTMAAMESTGGVRTGGIEIDLGGGTVEGYVGNQADDNNVAIHGARVKLTRIVQVLSTKHMPRLSSWVEGLTRADSLTAHGTVGAASLVSLPLSMATKRGEILRQLLELKTVVSSILSSCRKLQIDGGEGPSSQADGNEATTANPSRPEPRPLTTANAAVRRSIRPKVNRVRVIYRRRGL